MAEGEPFRSRLVFQLRNGNRQAISEAVADLARAVAREEIERWAKGEGVDRMRESAGHVVREEIERANLNQGDTDGSGTGDVRRRAEGRGVLARGGDPRGPSGGTGDREMAALSNNRPTVAPVSGEPGGVRVVATEEALGAAWSVMKAKYDTDSALHAALPHLRVEVDQDTLEEALIDAYNHDGTITEIVHAFTRKLGIHLSDGGQP